MQIPSIPLLFNTKSNCYIVRGKQKKQHCASLKEVQPNKRKRIWDKAGSGHNTYTGLDFQVGRAPGFETTPKFTAPISFARIWALLTPAKNIRKSALCSVAISFLRLINVALCTSITSGKFPFAWSRSKNLVIYLYCDAYKAGKLTFKPTSGSSLLLEASSASSYLRFTIRYTPPPLYLHISLVFT